MGRVTYNFIKPEGMGAVSADFKPERVDAPSLSGICFQNMRSVADLETLQAGAPGQHAVLTARIQELAEARAARKAGVRPRDLRPKQRVQVKASRGSNFGRGATVYDKVKSRSGIIIQANAGHTSRTNTPVHRVTNERGTKTWLAKEYDLKLLH